MLDDDKVQSPKASKLITKKQTVLITDVVLVESIWTLRGKKLSLKIDAIIAVIQTLFEEPNIRFENGQTVWVALSDYRDAKLARGKGADFSDALIMNKSKLVIESQGEKFGGFYNRLRKTTGLAPWL